MNIRAKIGPTSARVSTLQADLGISGVPVPENRGGAQDALCKLPAAIHINLIGSYRAEALVDPPIVVDYEGRRRGSPITDLARKLARAGYDPDSQVQIWRGGGVSFKPAPLRIWAKLRAVERDGRSATFETFDAMPKDKAAALTAAKRG